MNTTNIYNCYILIYILALPTPIREVCYVDCLAFLYLHSCPHWVVTYIGRVARDRQVPGSHPVRVALAWTYTSGVKLLPGCTWKIHWRRKDKGLSPGSGFLSDTNMSIAWDERRRYISIKQPTLCSFLFNKGHMNCIKCSTFRSNQNLMSIAWSNQNLMSIVWSNQNLVSIV